jgi:ubiquinone/menaquinone biosynthesis C-methylase UbiE/TusA-related sulfurtransferase
MVAITSLTTELVAAAVRDMYSQVAQHPEREYHFPIGRAACAFVGYPDVADTLPASAVESFAGVGYPFAANVIQPGDTVLDVGSGSGTDTLLAARETGPSGQVIALDMTPAMAAKLKATVSAVAAGHVRLVEGAANQLPLADASVDVVTSNGVFNLVVDKRAAFAELHRVLRPGGRVQIADIVVGAPLSGPCVSDPKLWAECIVGATVEDEYLAMLEQAGFVHVEAIGRFDYFSASPSAATRAIAESFQARACVVRAAKPPAAPLRPALAWSPAARPTAAGSSSVHAGVNADAPAADALLDGAGQSCGALEPLLKVRMRALESGQVLEVRADDPSARLGVAAWSRLTGHTLVATIEESDRHTRFFLRKR